MPAVNTMHMPYNINANAYYILYKSHNAKAAMLSYDARSSSKTRFRAMPRLNVNIKINPANAWSYIVVTLKHIWLPPCRVATFKKKKPASLCIIALAFFIYIHIYPKRNYLLAWHYTRYAFWFHLYPIKICAPLFNYARHRKKCHHINIPSQRRFTSHIYIYITL